MGNTQKGTSLREESGEALEEDLYDRNGMNSRLRETIQGVGEFTPAGGWCEPGVVDTPHRCGVW